MTESVEIVADAMFEIVKEYDGKKNLKAMDLIKAMVEKFGADRCDKKLGKNAIRILVEDGRCTYNYVGGSYIVLNPAHEA